MCARTIRDAFEGWMADGENKLWNRISYLPTDRGGEYEREWEDYSKKRGITHLPPTDESKGHGESLN